MTDLAQIANKVGGISLDPCAQRARLPGELRPDAGELSSRFRVGDIVFVKALGCRCEIKQIWGPYALVTSKEHRRHGLYFTKQMNN